MTLRSTIPHSYATPVGPDVHHDVLLSNLAVAAFSDGVDEFIGDQVFPAVTVGKQSDKYAVINQEAFFRIPDPLRAPKTEARRVEFQVSSESYFADNYALAGELALEDLANADAAFALRENETNLVVQNLRRAQEERIANTVTSLTNLGSGTTLTGTAKWSDFINSSPLSDVTTAHAFIRQQTGLIANTVIIDWDTMMIVRRHPELLDLFKYTSGGEVTDTQLREVFKVDTVLIGKGLKETSVEGASTTSMTNLWGNNVIFAHIEAATSLRTRTFGLRFMWNPVGFPSAFAVARTQEAGAGTKHVEVIEAQHWQDEKIIAKNLAYGIAGTL